jgi:hypothetical protein
VGCGFSLVWQAEHRRLLETAGLNAYTEAGQSSQDVLTERMCVLEWIATRSEPIAREFVAVSCKEEFEEARKKIDARRPPRFSFPRPLEDIIAYVCCGAQRPSLRAICFVSVHGACLVRWHPLGFWSLVVGRRLGAALVVAIRCIKHQCASLARSCGPLRGLRVCWYP